MGFFSKKQKVDYQALFKEKYKKVNQLNQDAHNELDSVIKESLYALIVDSYDELLSLIDQGAPFDKEHFIALKEDAVKQYQIWHQMNQGE